MYKIDLDEGFLYIEDVPFYHLHTIPPLDIFLASIGYDHYGRRACMPDTPAEYTLKHDKPVVMIEQHLLDTYLRLTTGSNTASVLDLHELLRLSSEICRREAIRIRLLEVVVGHEMSNHDAEMCKLPFATDVSEFGGSVVGRLRTIILSTLWPATYGLPVQTEVEGNWFRDNIYLYLSTNLDDESVLHVSATKVSEEVMRERPNGGIVYGILFSGCHIAIIRIDRTAGGSLAHTRTFPFMPSAFATSPSTEGITALARLAYLPDPNAVERTLMSLDGSNPFTSSSKPSFPLFPDGVLFEKLPLEILWSIAGMLPDVHDVCTFASICPRTMAACANALREPIIHDWHITGLASADSERRIVTPSKSWKEGTYRHRRYCREALCSAIFMVRSTTESMTFEMPIGRGAGYYRRKEALKGGDFLMMPCLKEYRDGVYVLDYQVVMPAGDEKEETVE